MNLHVIYGRVFSIHRLQTSQFNIAGPGLFTVPGLVTWVGSRGILIVKDPTLVLKKNLSFRLNLIFFFSFCLFPYLFSTAVGRTYFSVQTGKVMIQRDGKCSLYVAEFLFVIGGWIGLFSIGGSKMPRRIQERPTGRLSCLRLIILSLFL